jgi:hypothetical protein
MDVTLIITLLILALGVLFILGLIAPAKFTTWGGSSPHRGKAFFYLMAAFILLLVLGSMADDALMKKINETPREVTELDLSDKDLSTFPEYLTTLVNLTELNLSDNQLTSVSENIRGLDKLSILNLSNNPITSIPEWVLELKGLSFLDVSFTDVDSSSLPLIAQLRDKGITVDYDLSKGRADYANREEEETADTPKDDEEDEHAESFTEFAKRRLLGGRGTDQRRKYGKGEIFYDSGMDHAMLDSLGAALTDLGLFTPDKEVSVKLLKEKDVYLLKIVTNYEGKEAITDDIRLSWQLIRLMIIERVFEGEKLELHLCDPSLDIIEKIKAE